MDIKPYIDSYEQLKSFPRDKQFDLLEQAVKNIHSHYGFAVLELAPQIIRIIFILLCAAASYTFFDTAMWAFIAGIIVALICSRITISEFTDRVLQKELNRIIAKTE